MANIPTSEEIARAAAALEELSAANARLGEEQAAIILQASQLLSTLQQQHHQLQANITQRELEIKKMQESGIVDQQRRAQLENEMETARAQAATYVQNQATIDSALENSAGVRQRLHNQQMEQVATSNQQQMDFFRDQQIALDDTANLGLEAFRGVSEGVGSTIANINTEMAGAAMLFPNQARGAVSDLKDDFAKMQTEIKATGKATGIASENFEQMQVMAADTEWARRMIPPDVRMELEALGGTIDGTGMRIADTSPAFKSMHDNIQVMRPSWMDANQAVSIFTGNVVGNLAKVGVSTDTSTKSMDNFHKVVRLTPTEAAKAMTSLVTVADTLEISTTRAFEDFNNNIGTMSQYGEEAIGVFSRLEAQSINTGLGVNRLTEYASGLDTFEGAAKVAQQFNAVMGDTFLSVSDLVEADHDEKILMIQEAMEASGVSFEEADRRVKQVITSALGLTDTAEAARMLSSGTAEAYEIKEAQVSVDEKSTEALEKQIQGTMTMQEQLTKSTTAMQGGMFEFNNRALKFGSEGAEIVLNVFREVLQVTKDSESAALGTVAALDFVVTGGTRVAEALRRGNFGEAVKAAGLLGGTALGASLIPGATEAAGLAPTGQAPASPPGLRPMGLAEAARLQTERAAGATGESGLADQIMQLTNAIKEGSLLTADITTNVQLDGNTIDTITERTAVKASANVRDEMTRRTRGLPTIANQTGQ